MRGLGDTTGRLVGWSAALALTLLALLLVPGAARSGTIEVTTGADQFGSRPSKCSLREAIRAANTDSDFGGCNDRGSGGDTIRLRARDYVLSRAGALEDAGATGDLDVTGVLRIRGRALRRTTVDANGLDRVFDVRPGARLTLKALSAEGGAGSVGGGVLSGAGSRTVLNRARVARNEAEVEGAGIFAIGADVVVRRSRVTGNRGVGTGKGNTNGGGINAVGGSLVLTRSVVRNNSLEGIGGGVRVVAGRGEIRNSTISGNEAGLAAGLAVSGDAPIGRVQVTNSTIRGNVAEAGGGGLTIFIGAEATLVRSRVLFNRAGINGGAVFLSSGQLEVDRSTLAGNRAGGRGGAIATERTAIGGAPAPVVELEASTLSGNRAGEGGAVYALDAQAFLTNATVSGNRADNDGGGFLVTDPNAADALMVIYNSTVTRNVAVSGGGGIDRTPIGGPVILDHTILAENSAAVGPDCSGGPESQGRVLVGDASNCGLTAVAGEDQVGSAANPINPGLKPLRDNGGPTRTHALRRSSRARNAGDSTAGKGGCFFTDQRGVPRPVGRCDLGAYEWATCFRKPVNVVGTPGRDRLVGSRKADVILALGGRDLVLGRGGPDRACGGGGGDRLRGDAGNDRLSGGPGNDSLDGGPGSDRCRGGPGRDTLESC